MLSNLLWLLGCGAICKASGGLVGILFPLLEETTNHVLHSGSEPRARSAGSARRRSQAVAALGFEELHLEDSERPGGPEREARGDVGRGFGGDLAGGRKSPIFGRGGGVGGEFGGFGGFDERPVGSCNWLDPLETVGW